MVSSYTSWTEEQVSYLAENNHKRIKEIAAELGHPYSSVAFMRGKLDVLLSLGFRPSICTSDRSTVKPHYKTPYEIRLFGKKQMVRFIEIIRVTMGRKLEKLNPAIKVVNKEKPRCFIIPYTRTRQAVFDDEFHIRGRIRARIRREKRNSLTNDRLSYPRILVEARKP